MDKKLDIHKAKDQSEFSKEIGAKVERKLKARRNKTSGIWSGLGMMGVIGWSVAIPTLLGISLGVWLDKHHPGTRSWTLALLVAGLLIGCWNAWYWVARESKAMQDENDEHEDKDE